MAPSSTSLLLCLMTSPPAVRVSLVRVELQLVAVHVVLNCSKVLICHPSHLAGDLVAEVGGGIVDEGHHVAVLLAVVLRVLEGNLVAGVDDVRQVTGHDVVEDPGPHAALHHRGRGEREWGREGGPDGGCLGPAGQVARQPVRVHDTKQLQLLKDDQVVTHIKGGGLVDHGDRHCLAVLKVIHPLVVHLDQGGCGAVPGPPAVLVGVQQAVHLQVVHQLHEHAPLEYLGQSHKLVHRSVGRRQVGVEGGLLEQGCHLGP